MTAATGPAATTPTMRVYIAADFARVADAQALATTCANQPGVHVVSRWHIEPRDAEIDAARTGRDPGGSTATEAAERNIADIRSCDVMVVLTTGMPARGGRHFETGIAHAMGKRIILVGDREHAFHHLAGIEITSAAELHAKLQAEAPVAALGGRQLAEGLARLCRLQRDFDATHFTATSANELEAKRAHIALHVTILAGKLARIEERLAHGVEDVSVLHEEVVPDLLVYAAQLANLYNVDLADAYLTRLASVVARDRRDVAAAPEAQ